MAGQLAGVDGQVGQVAPELIEDRDQAGQNRLGVGRRDDAEHDEHDQGVRVLDHHRRQRAILRLALEGAGQPEAEQDRRGGRRRDLVPGGDDLDQDGSGVLLGGRISSPSVLAAAASNARRASAPIAGTLT